MRALLVFLLISLPLAAEESSFDQGLKAYQAKNWDVARDNFEKALQNHPDEGAIFYNLGLTYFQLGKHGYAVGYWRKALATAPGLNAASSALDQIEEKYHFGQLDRSPWAAAAHSLFQRFSWNVWLVGLAVLLSLTGLVWLSFFEKRKIAINSEAEAPSVSWTLLFLTVLLVAAIAGNLGKFLDQQRVRATVVSNTSEIRSAPSKDGVSLAPISEGSEIGIVDSHEDWVQVNTGDGSTGWLPKSDVLITGRGSPW
jgi:tetratricopeptide (TPR) repeat protein